MKNTREDRRKAWTWALMIALFAVLTIGALLLLRKPQPTEPAYTPPPMDALAVSALDWGELPTLNADRYLVSLNPDLWVDAGGHCEIWFKNPERNQCTLMLDVRLKESGLLIYRTGRVAPGEGIEEILFVPDALASMEPGAQAVVLTVYSFELDSYLNLGDIGLETQLTYNP